MVRIGSGSSNGGEFSINRNTDRKVLDDLSKNSSKVGKLVTSQTKSRTELMLTGHVTTDFKAPDYLQAMRKRFAKD